MARVWGVLGIAGLLAIATPVLAHHSFAAEFDIEKPITLKGTITKVEWINPHVYVYLDVKDQAGTSTLWSLESLSTAAIRRGGVNKAMLGVGQSLSDRQNYDDPAFHCKPQGVPRIGPPSQVVQTPGQVVLLYGNSNLFRVVYADGRAHRTDVETSYTGDAAGRWEGDTLVVDVNQFNDDTWLGSDATSIRKRCTSSNGSGARAMGSSTT